MAWPEIRDSLRMYCSAGSHSISLSQRISQEKRENLHLKHEIKL